MSPEHPPPEPRAPGPAVDPRIEQANERTLLAWIRTGLGLIAFGFVVARAGVWLGSPGGAGDDTIPWIGVGFVVVGTIFTVLAAVEHARIAHAIRSGHPIRSGRLAPVLAGLVAILGLALVALLVWYQR